MSSVNPEVDATLARRVNQGCATAVLQSKLTVSSKKLIASSVRKKHDLQIGLCTPGLRSSEDD